MTAADDTGRATVREVYQLVDKTRDDLTSQLDQVRNDLGDKISDLSTGITVIKDGLLPRVSILEIQSGLHGTDIDQLRVDVDTLQTAHQRALGHLSAWRLAGGVAGGAAAIVIADVVFKALGG